MHGRALAASIGRVGAWTFALDELSSSDGRDVARTVEDLGFGALWFPETQGSKEALSQAAVLLAATERLPIATGIANVWGRDAVADGERRPRDCGTRSRGGSCWGSASATRRR